MVSIAGEGTPVILMLIMTIGMGNKAQRVTSATRVEKLRMSHVMGFNRRRVFT